jgi:phage replication initiation protein
VYADWVEFTIDGCEADGLHGWLESAFFAYLPGAGIKFEPGHGFRGYKRSTRICSVPGDEVGRIAWEGNRGSCHCYLSGTLCGQLGYEFWKRLHGLLMVLKARITRIDIAVDFYNGEHGVEEVRRAYLANSRSFCTGGRPPRLSICGDWDFRIHGRTVYLGSRQNGKYIRVYEKGKKHGDLESKWNRFEVELHSKDRVIPCDVLLPEQWLSYFAGAAPYFAKMVAGTPKQILTIARSPVEGVKIAFSKAAVAVWLQYGQFIGFALELLGVAAATKLLVRPGTWKPLRKHSNAMDIAVTELAESIDQQMRWISLSQTLLKRSTSGSGYSKRGGKVGGSHD